MCACVLMCNMGVCMGVSVPEAKGQLGCLPGLSSRQGCSLLTRLVGQKMKTLGDPLSLPLWARVTYAQPCAYSYMCTNRPALSPPFLSSAGAENLNSDLHRNHLPYPLERMFYRSSTACLLQLFLLSGCRAQSAPFLCRPSSCTAPPRSCRRAHMSS